MKSLEKAVGRSAASKIVEFNLMCRVNGRLVREVILVTSDSDDYRSDGEQRDLEPRPQMFWYVLC